jgi:hypothetical protein
MRKSLRGDIKKISWCIGWFHGEQLKLVHVSLFDFNDGFISIIDLQFLKFAFQILYNHGGII